MWTCGFLTWIFDFDKPGINQEIIRKLKLHYAPETPVAVVFYAGFKGKQTVVRGSLDDISSRVDVGNLPLEHIIFVGDFLAYDLTGIEQEGQ